MTMWLRRVALSGIGFGVLLGGVMYSQDDDAAEIPAALGISTISEAASGWFRRFGTADYDYGTGVSATTDGVYVVGFTHGTLPEQTSSGLDDAYVRRYGIAGNLLWTRQFGSPSTDSANAVSATSEGVYVVGQTHWALPGQTSAGGYDVFVRKYDLAGNELWTRQFGTTEDDIAFGVSATAEGVYVAGRTGGVLPGQSSAGDADIFVRKYDLAGNELWTRQFGSAMADYASSVSAVGNSVYVVGQTLGALPGQTDAGFGDVFVRRYDVSGNELWTRQFGSCHYFEGQCIGGDTDFGTGVSAIGDAVYVVGFVYADLPGQPPNSGSGPDAFVRKYDRAGNELWTRQFGSCGVTGQCAPGFGLTDYATGVSAAANLVYITGSTGGALPGQTNRGAFDAFLRIYDNNGNTVGTLQFGSTNNDSANAVSAFTAGVNIAGELGKDLGNGTVFLSRITF